MYADVAASFAGNVVKAVVGFVKDGNPLITVPALTAATALVVGTGMAHTLNQLAGFLDPRYRER
jgi:uncharacterized membrane protein